MSERTREPEFYANATLGFRQWYFSRAAEANEPPLLQGLAKHGFHLPRYRWHLERPNYAECSRPGVRLVFDSNSLQEPHGEVPGVSCSCGFYAHGRRDGFDSGTTVHLVEGLIAGWGHLELHERGFKCSVATILALFEPPPRESPADYGGLEQKKRAALVGLCADNAISLLPPDALRDEEEVRCYASDLDLMLLEDQLCS
ncbi:MAG: hypothetical protein H0V53_10350 [Rubrobacter sp.]|nr:hypothetical protein [Rubrobacter sp.]